MAKTIKNGQEVIHTFLAEMRNIPSAEPAIVDKLRSLHQQKKLTEWSLQAAVDQFIQHKIKIEDE